MKSILIRFSALTLIAFVFSSLQAQRALKPVVINGKLGDKGSFTQIYLDTLNGKNPWIFAQAPINSDGTFQLNVSITTPDIYRLRLDDKNFLMMILSPGENISLTTPGIKLSTDVSIEGSVHSKLLYNNLSQWQFFESRRESLNKQYNEVQQSPYRDSLSAIIINDFRANDSLQKVTLKTQMEKLPASLAWIFFQDKLDMTADFDIIDKTEVAMYKTFPENDFIKQYHDQVEHERKTATGHEAPEIALTDPDGKIRKLSSLKGKVVLIDFWASWCGPCRKENPNVVKIYQQYKDKGFEVFSVSLDKDKTAWINAIAKDNLLWPNHVSDLKYWKSEGALTYGVSSIPYTVLLDKKGRIVSKKLRGEELEQKVAELLK